MSHEKISHGDHTLQALPDIVKQVLYLPDNDYIISSTSSAQQSLVISPADRKDFKKTYVFNIDKVPQYTQANSNINLCFFVYLQKFEKDLLESTCIHF